MNQLLPGNESDWLAYTLVSIGLFWSCILPSAFQNWVARRYGLPKQPRQPLYRVGMLLSAMWFVVLIMWRLVVIFRGHW